GLLQPLVDLPAVVAVGLGDAQDAGFQAFDHALDRRTGGVLDLVDGKAGAALEGAFDHQLQFVDLLRLGVGGGTHRSSPSRQASSASLSACRRCSSSGRSWPWSSVAVIWNTSSARSPKVAMRASCTRRPWRRRTSATSASSPGRSVAT